MSPRHSPRHRPSHHHQWWLYSTSALLLITGLGWLIAHYALSHEGAFGPEPNPSEAWWLRLHGASVILFLITFGALLPIHVIHNWRRWLHRKSGGVVVGFIALLALSGYGLYYVVNDNARHAISLLHWIVGLASAGGFAAHILIARRRRPA